MWNKQKTDLSATEYHRSGCRLLMQQKLYSDSRGLIIEDLLALLELVNKFLVSSLHNFSVIYNTLFYF